MKNIFHRLSKKEKPFRNPYITKENPIKPKSITNKDVDLSDDLIFDREIKGIKQIGEEPTLSETGCIHVGTGIIIRQKEFSEIFCKGIQCDCCGEIISPLSFSTLCDKCNKRMEKDLLYDKIFESQKNKQAILDKVWFVKQNI
ncbi:hypothetical protein [Thomasclavelia cocleata]|uniref:hypothetical protein n=1 Tax=Thomasclavelia cocleata TaxID=69824 RepID=UPI00256EE456|nr:hypothetical protein [Thomasclavelia cocleata]